MRFWDTSALVALLIEEPRSVAARRMLRDDRGVAVWVLTRIELVSAIRRRERDGDIDTAEVGKTVHRIDGLEKGWTEVSSLDSVCERAERLLGVHPIRAADALQLGAALVLVKDRPRRRGFVTADTTLAQAAAREGFETLVPA